jgi:hypothetical protein
MKNSSNRKWKVKMDMEIATIGWPMNGHRPTLGPVGAMKPTKAVIEYAPTTTKHSRAQQTLPIQPNPTQPNHPTQPSTATHHTKLTTNSDSD